MFYSLLKQIGFDVKIISARVYDSKKEAFGKEFDHLAIIVKLNQIEYLVDVGFGEFVLHPLKFELNHIQSDPIGNFIIEADKNECFKISKIKGGIKSVEYLFTMKERTLNEFSEMCNYHQTSSSSPFTQKKLITKPTKNGRITITGNTLKIKEDGLFKDTLLLDEEDYAKQLLKWFNIAAL